MTGAMFLVTPMSLLSHPGAMFCAEVPTWAREKYALRTPDAISGV